LGNCALSQGGETWAYSQGGAQLLSAWVWFHLNSSQWCEQSQLLAFHHLLIPGVIFSLGRQSLSAPFPRKAEPTSKGEQRQAKEVPWEGAVLLLKERNCQPMSIEETAPWPAGLGLHRTHRYFWVWMCFFFTKTFPKERTEFLQVKMWTWWRKFPWFPLQTLSIPHFSKWVWY
jgi:hypothetical protein